VNQDETDMRVVALNVASETHHGHHAAEIVSAAEEYYQFLVSAT
jgi:hypothetical protein